MKKASGKLAAINCITCKEKRPFTLLAYDDTAKRGGVRVAGLCDKGHKASSLVKRAEFADMIKSGKIIVGGAGCPYSGGVDNFASSSKNEDDTDRSIDIDMFEGAARSRSSRGSRGSQKRGSRKSRSSRKSHGSRGSQKRGSRKSRGSRRVSKK